jgi:hypothetical protein
VVETYVYGESAKSAERGLFVQCWQGIGRNCHDEFGVKARDSFTCSITQGLFHVDVVEPGWACNTSLCLCIVDMKAASE